MSILVAVLALFTVQLCCILAYGVTEKKIYAWANLVLWASIVTLAIISITTKQTA